MAFGAFPISIKMDKNGCGTGIASSSECNAACDFWNLTKLYDFADRPV